MKREYFIVIAVFTCLIYSFKAGAQGLYLKLGSGYNFATASNISFNSNVTQNNTGYNVKVERVKVNLGKGIPVMVSAGYLLPSKVGGEISFGYLWGGTSTISRTVPSYIVSGTIKEYTTETNKTMARMLLIQPSFVLYGNGDKLIPYARLGGILAKGTVYIERNYTSSPGNRVSGEQKFEMTGGWGFGFQGSFGAEFKSNAKTAFFGEITLNSLAYAPEKAQFKKYVADGNDLLHTLTVRQKEIDFVDELEVTISGAGADMNKPEKQIKQNLPFSSIGIVAGLRIKFYDIQ